MMINIHSGQECLVWLCKYFAHNHFQGAGEILRAKYVSLHFLVTFTSHLQLQENFPFLVLLATSAQLSTMMHIAVNTMMHVYSEVESMSQESVARDVLWEVIQAGGISDRMFLPNISGSESRSFYCIAVMRVGMIPRQVRAQGTMTLCPRGQNSTNQATINDFDICAWNGSKDAFIHTGWRCRCNVTLQHWEAKVYSERMNLQGILENLQELFAG